MTVIYFARETWRAHCWWSRRIYNCWWFQPKTCIYIQTFLAITHVHHGYMLGVYLILDTWSIIIRSDFLSQSVFLHILASIIRQFVLTRSTATTETFTLYFRNIIERSLRQNQSKDDAVEIILQIRMYTTTQMEIFSFSAVWAPNPLSQQRHCYDVIMSLVEFQAISMLMLMLIL